MFNQVCLDLLTLLKPTVAAITGHAIAGGCILALCCDYRFIAKGHKLMGLNKVKLGLPVPYLPDRLLRAVAGVCKAREIMKSGKLYPSNEALEMGIVDKILAIENVVKTAIEHEIRDAFLSRSIMRGNLNFLRYRLLTFYEFINFKRQPF